MHYGAKNIGLYLHMRNVRKEDILMADIYGQYYTDPQVHGLDCYLK